ISAIPGQSPASPIGYETNVLPVPEISSAQTPQNEIIPKDVTGQPRPRRYLLPILVVLAALLTLGLISIRLIQKRSTIDSVAVLPFANVTGASDADYLSDGITEGIINSLSQLPELSVSARNSVIRYRGQEPDARTIGPELDVEAVLLGRLERRGNNLTINAEL